jgi:hypothetical protein
MAEARFSDVSTHALRWRLGNLSAIDLILDQQREKPLENLVIRAKFNTCRFADCSISVR